MSRKILILATHPDDDVLSFGGLMSKAQRRGDKVYLHVFCVGGPCSNVSADIRLEELKNVADYFNVQLTYDKRQLDGLLSTVPSCEITGIIDNLIKDYEPDEVYCNAYSEHADHKSLYEAFLGSARLKSGFMPKLFAIGVYPFSDQLYTEPAGGKIFNPLTEDDFNRKCEAFQLYKSQFKPSPSPLGLDGIKNQAHYNGMMCGHKYAELYYQLRYIRCMD